MDDEKTPRQRAAQVLPVTFLSRDALLARGARARDITRLVAEGRLIRLRNGRYVGADAPDAVVRAGSLGARLDCVSLLGELGVFIHTQERLHVQVERGSTRLPKPGVDVVRHWRGSSCEHGRLCADIVDALAQAVRCQPLRAAIATLDSAWHHGLVDEEQINDVFAVLPRRYGVLRDLLDPRAESGPETIMRLMLRGLGCTVDVQVKIHGVGRVDFVVDGWLIVECDSRKYHEGWNNQKRDRRRDLVAAALGYTTVRPIAEDILYNRERVLAMLTQILATPPARPVVQKSSTSRRRASKSARSAPRQPNLAEF
ncbi:endonuclease domain-containing protein [Microbacterium sp.]|uniref:endonuclease domain-containing protein n=1 Tax=Microbacterium sp. TaxID=51671 RepID=UPI003A92BF57